MAKEPTEVLSLRLPVSLMKLLTDEAERCEMKPSLWALQTLEQRLRGLPEAEEPAPEPKPAPPQEARRTALKTGRGKTVVAVPARPRPEPTFVSPAEKRDSWPSWMRGGKKS